MLRLTQSAQSILEYFLLIGIVTLAVVFMGPDFKRGIQSVVKVTADQLASQQNAEQDFSQQTGFLVNSTTDAWSSRQKSKNERFGKINVQSYDFQEALTNSLSNSAFTPMGGM